MICVRPSLALVLALISVALTACASDDSGVRALDETRTLRAQMDDVRQRQDGSTREITRLQSQVRALETDAVDKTRDVKAANVELARARVLLEETRGMLRERETASAGTPAATRPIAMTPAAAPEPAVAPPPPPTPVTPPPFTKSAPPVAAARPATPSPSVARPTAPDPKAIPEWKESPRPAPEAKPLPTPSSEGKPEPELKAAAMPAAGLASEAQIAPRPAPVPAPSAEKLFSAAMANFKAQEHGQAVLELTDLITRYPSHNLAPTAQVWIGEAYYQQRDYRQALIELKRVSEAYPRSPQVADALLRSGLCQKALGNRAAATAAWSQVVHTYPSSAAAGQAKNLLEASASTK